MKITVKSYSRLCYGAGLFEPIQVFQKNTTFLKFTDEDCNTLLDNALPDGIEIATKRGNITDAEIIAIYEKHLPNFKYVSPVPNLDNLCLNRLRAIWLNNEQEIKRRENIIAESLAIDKEQRDIAEKRKKTRENNKLSKELKQQAKELKAQQRAQQAQAQAKSVSSKSISITKYSKLVDNRSTKIPSSALSPTPASSKISKRSKRTNNIEEAMES